MRLPIVSRRRYDDDLADAKAEANRQRERAEKAEAVATTEVANRRTITDQYSQLYDTHERVVRRHRALCAQLEAAQVGAGFDAAKAKQTADRIARLRKAVAKARAEAAAAAKAPDERGARLVAELSRSRQAHASLDAQCRTLQTANEAMVRELHDLRTGGGE
ncbi:hypothetical protein [Streptomyces sp. NPDC004008]